MYGSENTPLYAVHPFRLFTASSGANLSVAEAAYAHRQFPCNDGWCQDIIDAALLGNAADLRSMSEARAAAPPADGYSFPAFASHYQDFPVCGGGVRCLMMHV